jgi:hypothetical protein
MPHMVSRPEDWEAVGVCNWICYAPDELMFELVPCDGLLAEHCFGPDDWTARVFSLHGDPLPRESELNALCKDAVLMNLLFEGVLHPADVRPGPRSQNERAVAPGSAAMRSCSRRGHHRRPGTYIRLKWCDPPLTSSAVYCADAFVVAEAGLTFCCPRCEAGLLVAEPGQVNGVVFHCAWCGAFSATATPAGGFPTRRT